MQARICSQELSVAAIAFEAKPGMLKGDLCDCHIFLLNVCMKSA